MLIDSLDSDLRHAKNKEFYEMTAESAYDILSAIAQINGDEDLLIKNPLNDEYFSDGTHSKTVRSTSGPQKRQSPRARLTFEMLGIPVGSTLVYSEDPAITAETVDLVSSVRYQGSVYTLSSLVKHLKHGGSWQGGIYFTYNGKKLTKMREELEKSGNQM